MRESLLETRFAQRVKMLGGKAIKLAPTEVGVPDRLVLMPDGLHFLVELKAEGGALHPAQEHWHETAAALGHEVVVLKGAAAIDDWTSPTCCECGNDDSSRWFGKQRVCTDCFESLWAQAARGS